MQKNLGKILIDTTLHDQEDLFKLVEELQVQLECYNRLQVLILESFESNEDVKVERQEVKCETEDCDDDSGEDLKEFQDSDEDQNDKPDVADTKEIKVRKRKKGMKYKTKKDPNGDHMCDKCGDVVRGLAEYRRHRRRHNEAGAHFKMVTKLCPHCDKEITTNAGRFKYHKIKCEAAHVDGNNFVCDKCSKTFPTARYLLQHQYTCSVKRESNKKKPGYETSKKPCPYEDCGHTSWNKITLENHINRVHLKVGISKDFVCQECGKSYNKKDQLQEHITVIHNNIKPHVCTECGKSFGRKTRLREHMDIHLGIARHKCPYCSRAFTNHGSMWSHKNKCTMNAVDKPLSLLL